MYMYVGVIMNAQQNMWWKLVEHTNQIDTVHARYQRVRQDAGGGPRQPDKVYSPIVQFDYLATCCIRHIYISSEQPHCWVTRIHQIYHDIRPISAAVVPPSNLPHTGMCHHPFGTILVSNHCPASSVTAVKKIQLHKLFYSVCRQIFEMHGHTIRCLLSSRSFSALALLYSPFSTCRWSGLSLESVGGRLS